MGLLLLSFFVVKSEDSLQPAHKKKKKEGRLYTELPLAHLS